jgi:hypothetical protein
MIGQLAQPSAEVLFCFPVLQASLERGFGPALGFGIAGGLAEEI